MATNKYEFVRTSAQTKPTTNIIGGAGALLIETDTGDVYEWDGNSWNKTISAGVNLFNLNNAIAGERNTNSATNSYQITRRQANVSIIAKTTTVTIGGGAANDTYLLGLYIHTALTGTCVITGFADSDDVAQSYTIPAGAVGDIPIEGENTAGAITITCAADNGLVWVMWRPI